MIQRKQSLFLLAVAIIAIAQFFLPFQVVNTTNVTFPVDLLTGFKTPSITSNIYFALIFNIIILILSITIIFLYKNRVLQYKLANLLVVFNMFLVGLFFILSYSKESGPEAISYQIGSFLPLVSAILAYLAAYFIKKDEQLVRNADRIR